MPDFDIQDALEMPGIVPVNQGDPGPLDYAQLLGYGQPAPATAGPVTQPGQVPDAGPANTPGLTVTGQPGAGLPLGAAGRSASVSGYSPGAFSTIQKTAKAPGGIEGQLAADRADTEGRYAPLLDIEAEATRNAIESAAKVGAIESQRALTYSQGKQKIAEANQEFLAKEQAASDNAKVESQTSINQYRAAIKDYMATKIQPNQLWENAGTGGQVGIIMTAFLHDFLGARGIKTSGMDSINQAINRNMNAQLENMRKKLDVANGFKELWTMQRAQSATDAEARARMNGFYLASLSNGIEGQLGQYDSELALTKAQAAKSALLQEMIKNDLNVQQHIDNASNQRAQNRIHLYAAQLSASSAKYSADMHYKAAQAGKNLVSPLEGAFVDTSRSGSNTFQRRFLPSVEKSTQNKVQQSWSHAANMADDMQKLIEIQHNIDAAPPDIGVDALKRMQSEQRRLAEQMRNLLKMGIIYDNSGKQINEQEVKLYDEIVAKKDWFTNGENTRLLANLAATNLKAHKAEVAGLTTEILPGDPLYGKTTGSTEGLAPGESTILDIEKQPGGGEHQNTNTEGLIKQALSPDAEKPASMRGEAGQATREVLGKNDLPSVEESRYEAFAKDNPTSADSNAVPKGFIAVDKIADAARAGDTQAQQQLKSWAAGQGTYLLKEWATWELKQK